MPLHWFEPAVYVETDKVGRSYAVSNVEKAAELLLSWRDASDRKEWRIAVAACMAAIKNEVPPAEARTAFEAAAKAAGRLI